MINKLYKLKKTQLDQKYIQRSELQNKIDLLDTEINETNLSIQNARIDRFGAISDFSILEMHKNTMKLHIQKLNKQKELLVVNMDQVKRELLELNKESEQYAYILEEEKKERLKRQLLAEEEAASEFMQSKYIKG